MRTKVAFRLIMAIKSNDYWNENANWSTNSIIDGMGIGIIIKVIPLVS